VFFIPRRSREIPRFGSIPRPSRATCAVAGRSIRSGSKSRPTASAAARSASVVARAYANVATSKRDAAIREAHRAGASLRDIAAQSGISHMSVKRIVERTPD